MKSKTGLILSGLYIAIALYFILTQGLFGESFIAIILGLPWTMILAAFEFGGAGEVVGTFLLILTMLLNAVILYFIGRAIDRKLIS